MRRPWWRPRWTHDHWKISAKSSQWYQYPILKMAMVKSMRVALKVACEWGPRVSDTLDIFEQTDNSLSPWSTKNSQASWSYGLTICPPICGPQTPAWTSLITRSIEARSKHNSNIPSSDRLCSVSPQITNQVANGLNALLSMAMATSGYALSLKKWYMSWYHGKPSSNSVSSIKQQ